MKIPVGHGDARVVFTDNWEDFNNGAGNDLTGGDALIVLPFKNGAVFVEISSKDGDIDVIYLSDKEAEEASGQKDIVLDGEAIRFPSYPWRALLLKNRAAGAIRWRVTALGE